MRYAVSDIHGCARTLAALLDRLALSPGDRLYILGDSIDRGPDSRGVLDILMSLPDAVCLKGNHEDMAISAHANPKQEWDYWINNGGRATLESFGGKIPRRYLDFLQGLLPPHFSHKTQKAAPSARS